MFNNRTLYRLFSLFAALFLIAAGVRLFYLQVIKHGFYDQLVQTQSSVNGVFTRDRGLIYDCNGVVLAKNRKVASLYTFGKNVDDPSSFVQDLKANGITVSEASKKVIDNKGGFVWIARHIDVAKAEQIRKNVQNINYRLEDSRFYPEGNMLSGLIGYTGVDNQGLDGLEYHADKMLAGQIVAVSTIKDSRGKLILFDDGTIKTKPDSAVHLTIDTQMQAVAERILKEDRAKNGAKRAIALAMDVQTGDIVMSAYVKQAGLKDEFDKKNVASFYLFEPGSIFKVVTFAYLADAGLYKEKTVVDISKGVELYGHSFRDVGTYNRLTHKEIFTKSSNKGTISLMQKATKDGFYKFIFQAGFGKKLGIEGMGEEAGLLREPKKWSGLSMASISIGQEIMVTPVQIVRFYAAAANKGVAVKPSVVKKYSSGSKEYIPVKSTEKIMSEQCAAVVMDLMKAAVENGTGKKAANSVVNVGGKSGTAQMIDKKTKTYSKTDYVASFAGVFPLENPRYAMVVIYETPRTSIYGGDSAASTFSRLSEQLAFHYNLGPKVQYAGK